jgi:hypothetical protein
MINITPEMVEHGSGWILGGGGQKLVERGFMKNMKKALAVVERHHKRQEWIRGGDGPPHPEKLTVRTGGLSRSYTRRILIDEMAGAYGSDLIYAPVHEYGNSRVQARPGLKRTIDAKVKELEKILADGAVGEL